MAPKKKALLIDDDISCLKIMAKTLENVGFESYSFSSWESTTLQEIIDIAPDIIILDEFLQNTRGSLLCPIIKSVDQLRTTPVVLVSGLEGLEEVAKKCMADAYINKPVTTKEIAALFNAV